VLSGVGLGVLRNSDTVGAKVSLGDCTFELRESKRGFHGGSKGIHDCVVRIPNAPSGYAAQWLRLLRRGVELPNIG